MNQILRCSKIFPLKAVAILQCLCNSQSFRKTFDLKQASKGAISFAAYMPKNALCFNMLIAASVHLLQQCYWSPIKAKMHDDAIAIPAATRRASQQKTSSAPCRLSTWSSTGRDSTSSVSLAKSLVIFLFVVYSLNVLA